jgi:hypothetical protein
MIKRLTTIAAIALLGCSCLFADFSYEQTSTLTGGMMKSMAFLSKSLREPIRSTVMVKGDRMATISPQSGHIIDLASETITEINFQKRTYSVITFAQMAEALKAMQAKMKSQQGGKQMDVSFKPSVKETGETRTVNGMNAREMLVTVEFEGTDPKTNQRGTFMTMVADMWIAPDVPGYDEVRHFQARMAQKLNWVPGSFGAMTPGGQDSARAMAEVYKELAKLNGVPVMSVTKMGFGGAMPAGQQAEGAPPPQQEQQQQQAEAEKPSLGGALGRLGGRFGGFGRKKKQEQQQQEQQQPESAQGQAAGPAGASMMEVTTELTGFSSAPVDGSKFEVPAGFQQVESEMLKLSRR